MIAAKLLLAAALSAQPVTLTIHAGPRTYVVHAMYNSTVFSIEQLTVDYDSDRVFCSDFSVTDECWETLS